MSSPSPLKSTESLVPEPRTTLPTLAMISPSFFTPGATRNTNPFFATLISPLLITNDEPLPAFWRKSYLPARKSLS